MWILGLKGLITYTKTQVWDLIFFYFLNSFFQKLSMCAFKPAQKHSATLRQILGATCFS